MKIVWEIETQDVERVQALVRSHQGHPMVQERFERNLSETKPRIPKAEFWDKMVGCLLTTQQRSGPNSAVSRFLETEPFPLNYQLCLSLDDLRLFAQEVISNGGLRRSNRIADEVTENLHRLEQEGLWSKAFEMLDELRLKQDLGTERKAANFVQDSLKGFGPKQSRNFLQWLGLTRYEIPLDSRVTKWLNDFGFPVKLSAGGLSDRNYYNFVSEGVQQLCAESNVYPCVLDAAIFVSFDK